MDIYQIMARLDAIGSKKNLTESQDMMQPVAEGRFKELDIILQDFPEDVEEFKRSGDLGSRFYEALVNHYLDSGEMPYGVAKARTGDPYDWVVNRLASELGLDEASARNRGDVAEAKTSKPDFLDLDKDGDKKEPMKKAVADKKKGAVKESEQNMSRAAKGYEKYGKQGMQALAKAGKEGKSLDPVRKKYDRYDESLSQDDFDQAAIAQGKRGRDARDNPSKAVAAAKRSPAAQDARAKLDKVRQSEIKVKESAKPDFLDMDQDGNKKESMKKAVQDKTRVKKVDEAGKNLFPGTPEYELRFGKDDASSAFDKKKISTGTVYSRKHHEEPEAADNDDTPKKKGRPVGAKRRLGAKGPSVNSLLLKGKGGLKEHDIDIQDRGEYDREGDMALNQVHQIADAARELHAILASDDNLPEWVQSKITKALDYIDTARDYLGAEGEMDREELPEIAPIVGALAGRALAGAAGAGSTGQAIGSLAGRAVAGAMNGNDEVEEAGYSAKSARAGKDIGKPGKNFNKIAKGAAERYGSKAAGERVAGAVLNKLRAKEGVEEGPDTGIGSKLPKSDIETFGLQKGRPYKINPPQDFKPGDRKRAVQQLIPTQDKKDHIRSRLGKHVAPVLPEQDVEEESTNKKDVPFDGPYRKKGDDKDQFGNKIKHVARHAARQGLADMTTAELKAELKRRSQVEEESTDTQDQHAEKAGKKVTKDLEYDMKHKGKDDAKAEKAGKKVTKDIEYDDKKDKEKKVDETTVSGSVATGGDAPKKSKGGMQFGQGVYEGAIAESFDKKLGGILTEGMSVNVSTDDTGKKSITVNATDADADSLGNMLKMAGLFSSEGYSRTCESCHGIHEAGACQAEQVAEELANSPDEVYADKDYMTQTLSGGLNGPKTTGQTTGPVVNRQDSRQGVMAEAERVVEQSESRLWNLYKQYEKK
jgi:hypothetical protein